MTRDDDPFSSLTLAQKFEISRRYTREVKEECEKRLDRLVALRQEYDLARARCVESVAALNCWIDMTTRFGRLALEEKEAGHGADQASV